MKYMISILVLHLKNLELPDPCERQVFGLCERLQEKAIRLDAQWPENELGNACVLARQAWGLCGRLARHAS